MRFRTSTFIFLLCMRLLESVACAQASTLVRSESSVSPGMSAFTPPPETANSWPNTSVTVESTPLHNADMMPWWEGTEAVAIESMNQKRFGYGLGFLSGYEYDDNVFLSSLLKGEAHSYFFRLPLSLTYSGGMLTASLAYSPEYRFYEGEGLDDAFSQALSFFSDLKGARSGLGLDLNAAQTEGANVEVGERVDAVNVYATLRGYYQVSDKTSIGGSLYYNPMRYDSYLSYDRYSANVYADYSYSPKTTLGLGGGYEMVDSEGDSSSDSWSVVGRINWKGTEKIAVRGNAGFEMREFDAGASTEAPIFSLGATYQARANTLLTLDGYSKSTPSISEAGQVYQSTGLLAGVDQKIFSRLSLTLSAGYEYSEYESVSADSDASRKDHYFFGRSQLSYAIRERYKWAIYYQYSNNDSDGSDVSFDRNLIGTTFSISF